MIDNLKAYRMLAALALLAVAYSPATVSAQQTDASPRTLTVRGIGTIDRAPERAIVNLAVENEAASAAAAASANAAAAASMIAAVRQAGVQADDVRTVSYRIDPVRTRQPNAEPRITGYRAFNMVRVVVDPMDRLGAVIDAAIGAGANRVANVSFELRDADSALAEALALAMESARQQAESLATAAGQQLGEPLMINASDASPPVPMPVAFAAGLAEARQAPTPIEGGTITVQASVSVTYRIR